MRQGAARAHDPLEQRALHAQRHRLVVGRPNVHEIQVPEGDATRWPAEFREAPLDLSPVADDAVGRAGGARQPAVGAPTDPFEHCRRHILQIRIDGSSQVVSCC
jgi:hypothetical protein